MSKKEEENICDCCNKDVEHVMCREGYRMGYSVEWVCIDCYEDTYGMVWSELVEKAD